MSEESRHKIRLIFSKLNELENDIYALFSEKEREDKAKIKFAEHVLEIAKSCKNNEVVIDGKRYRLVPSE